MRLAREAARDRDDCARQLERLTDLDACAFLLGGETGVELGEQGIELGREDRVVDLRERALEGEVHRVRERVERDDIRNALLALFHVECTYSQTRRRRPRARGIGAPEDDEAVTLETVAAGHAELVPEAGRAFDADQRCLREGELDDLGRPSDLGLDGLPVPLGKGHEARAARRCSGSAGAGPTGFVRPCPSSTRRAQAPRRARVPSLGSPRMP